MAATLTQTLMDVRSSRRVGSGGMGPGRVKWIGVGMHEHMNVVFLCVDTL